MWSWCAFLPSLQIKPISANEKKFSDFNAQFKSKTESGGKQRCKRRKKESSTLAKKRGKKANEKMQKKDIKSNLEAKIYS